MTSIVTEWESYQISAVCKADAYIKFVINTFLAGIVRKALLKHDSDCPKDRESETQGINLSLKLSLSFHGL